MSDPFNSDVPPESSEATSSTDSRDAIPPPDQKSSHPASRTQCANMLKHPQRLDILKDEVENCDWSREAKTVFIVAIEVHLEQWLRNRGLRTGAINGQDLEAFTEKVGFEKMKLWVEQDDEFYGYLEAVRRRANAIFKSQARQRVKSLSSVGGKM